MYDELVKELRDSAEWADRLALLMGRAEGDAHAPVMRKAADAIEKLSKKYLASEVDNTNLTGWLAEEHAKQLWIPVTERLPDRRKWVLCRCQAGITDVLRYENAEWYHDPTHVYFFEFVTHWMPLPTPPKEET